MKHSNFDSILEAIKRQELAEFREALKKHGDTYYFVDPHDIMSQRKGEEIDDEGCPHVYVTGGSTTHQAHELVVHYVQLEEDDSVIRVYGRSYYEGNRSYSCDWQVEQGSWFELMDYMDDPEEED